LKHEHAEKLSRVGELLILLFDGFYNVFLASVGCTNFGESVFCAVKQISSFFGCVFDSWSRRLDTPLERFFPVKVQASLP